MKNQAILIAQNNHQEWNTRLRIDLPKKLQFKKLSEKENQEKNTILRKAAKNIANLYDCEKEGFTFFTTRSEVLITDRKGTVEYYQTLILPEYPKGTIIQQTIRPISFDRYCHSMICEFEIGPKDDRQKIIGGETFEWRMKKNSEWKIIHHHSSLPLLYSRNK